jgi:hypothetical protein
VMLNAQTLTMTRLCAAQDCDQDAEPSSPLCWRCIRKPSVTLHNPTQIHHDGRLECHSCHAWHPDEAFSLQTKYASRRGRHPECRTCNANRRRLARALMTPEEKRREADKQNRRRLARNLERQARLGWPPA